MEAPKNLSEKEIKRIIASGDYHYNRRKKEGKLITLDSTDKRTRNPFRCLGDINYLHPEKYKDSNKNKFKKNANHKVHRRN